MADPFIRTPAPAKLDAVVRPHEQAMAVNIARALRSARDSVSLEEVSTLFLLGQTQRLIDAVQWDKAEVLTGGHIAKAKTKSEAEALINEVRGMMVPSTQIDQRRFAQAASEFAQNNADELVSGLSRTSAKTVRDTVAGIINDRELAGQIPKAAKTIKESISLAPAQAAAVQRYASGLAASEISDAAFNRLVSQYAERQLLQRAETIAITEANRAKNWAQWYTWNDAANLGIVDRTKVTATWHTQVDERTCSQCGPMDGKVVGFDDEFDTSRSGTVVTVELPPAHARCRCTVSYATAQGDEACWWFIEKANCDPLEPLEMDAKAQKFDENAQKKAAQAQRKLTSDPKYKALQAEFKKVEPKLNKLQDTVADSRTQLYEKLKYNLTRARQTGSLSRSIVQEAMAEIDAVLRTGPLDGDAVVALAEKYGSRAEIELATKLRFQFDEMNTLGDRYDELELLIHQMETGGAVLSAEEQKALEYYTSSSYDELNRAMRGGPLPSALQPIADSLRSAVQKLSELFGTPTRVFRGMAVTEQQSKHILDVYRQGKVIGFEAFTSTSLDPMTAYSFSDRPGLVEYIFDIQPKPGGGGYLNPFTELDENEYLLLPNSRFRVTGVFPEAGINGETIIRLEEI